jgi:hypothetical protein
MRRVTICFVAAALIFVCFSAQIPIVAETERETSRIEQIRDEGSGGSDRGAEPPSETGAYLVEFYDIEKGSREPIPLVLTLNGDGCASSTEIPDLIRDTHPGNHSSSRGIWKTTDARTVEVRLLGITRTTAGNLNQVARATLSITFDDWNQTGQGSITVEWFHPFQVLDPADPNTRGRPLGGEATTPIYVQRLDLG